MRRRVGIAGPAALVTVLALICYVFVWTPLSEAHPTRGTPWPWEAMAPEAPRTSFPSTSSAFIGVYTARGAFNFQDQERFARTTRTQPQVYEFSLGWAAGDLDLSLVNEVAARGMLPMVSWEPWDYEHESPIDAERGTQPAFRLSRIIAGDYDDYIRRWVTKIGSLDYPVAVRLAHEMNGYWFPWSEQANGNSPGDYVRMWRHVHDIAESAGAKNVVWVWSPNLPYENSTPLAALYPGDEFVDWMGLSGYYGTKGIDRYVSFDGLFGRALAELQKLARKPVVITEVAATDRESRRAEWIADMFSSLPRHPEVIGMVWFEVSREQDWRLGFDREGAAAFAAGASAPRYREQWEPTSILRTAR